MLKKTQWLSVVISVLISVGSVAYIVRAGTLEFDGVAVDVTTASSEDLVICPGTGGNVQIGDATGTNTNATTNDDLHITGDIEVDGTAYTDAGISSGGDIAPETDSASSLGSSTAAWMELYTDYIKTTSATNLTILPYASAYTIIGDAGTAGNVSTNDDLFVSGALEVDGITYADGTIQTTSATTLVANPGTTGDIDLRLDTVGSLLLTGFGQNSQVTLSANLNQDDVLIKRDVDGDSGSYSEAGSLLRLERDVTNASAENGVHLEFTDSDTTAPAQLLNSSCADNASSVAFELDTTTALATSGGKLLSLKTGGTEKFSVAYDGSIAAAGSGVPDGSGTANYISKWLDSNTLTDSVMYDDGTNVGIGTTEPGAILHLSDTDTKFRLTDTTGLGGSDTVELRLNGGALEYTFTDANNKLLYWDLSTNPPKGGTSVITPGSSWSVGGNMAVGNTYRNLAAPTDGVIIEGNVGIGTATPAYKLDVSGGVNTSQSEGYRTNTNQVILQSDSTMKLGWVDRGNLANTYLTQIFSGGTGTATTPVMTLNGNVGIGTTSPNTKLEVNGSGVLMNIRNDTDSFLFVNETSGSVGIGTTSPVAKLSVVSDTAPQIHLSRNTTANDAYMRFNRGNYYWDIGQFGTGQSDFDFRSQTGGSVLFLEYDGNVGIGTTEPNSALEVTGGIGVNRAVAVATGDIDISGSYLTNGADYAEYFEAEGELFPGDIVGINMATGKVRKYIPGDSFVGIAGDNPGIVGNNKDNKEGYALVGLLGQMEFKQAQTVIEGRLVRTKDGKRIGVLLSNGKVLVGT